MRKNPHPKGKKKRLKLQVKLLGNITKRPNIKGTIVGCVYMSEFMYTYMYIYTCICICIYLYMCIHVYVYEITYCNIICL